MIRNLRQLSLLLVLSGLLIAGCGASSEENLGSENSDTTTDVAPSMDAIASGTVTASSLNIHEAPGTDTPILYGAPAGTEVDIFDETALGDSVWYQVRARSETLPSDLGWAFSRYIETGESSGQEAPQPGAPAPGDGAGGAGGLDPEAPGANPDTPGGIDPEAPGANPDNPGGSGGYPGESTGGSGGYPGESTGGGGGYEGEDSSRPSSNEDNSRPSME